MDQSPLLAQPQELLPRMSQLLHKAGINVRYMGAVRHRSANAFLRSVLMIEMMARTIKKLMWDGFRDLQLLQALPTEEPYRKYAVQQFNKMLATESPNFWFSVKREITAYFGAVALEPWERNDDYDLRRHCENGIAILVRRVAVLTGIRVSEDSLQELEQRQARPPAERAGFEFVDADVERIDTRIKSMNVVEISSAITLSMQASSSVEQDRLFKLCYRKFEAAANASPSNITVSRYWAQALFTHAQGLAANNPARACALLAEADMRMQDCFNVRASLRAHCEIVRLLAQLTVDVPQAAGLFCRALNIAHSVKDEELMLRVVADCRKFAAKWNTQAPAMATLVLNRMRVALEPLRELSLSFRVVR
jgi:hypothetical protein